MWTFRGYFELFVLERGVVWFVCVKGFAGVRKKKKRGMMWGWGWGWS